MIKKFDNEIVPGYALSRNQMKAYMELVENKENWKSDSLHMRF